MLMDKKTTSSPCVRNCCLDANDVCLGCHRSLDEILNWSSASTAEKQKILTSVAKRKEESKPSIFASLVE